MRNCIKAGLSSIRSNMCLSSFLEFNNTGARVQTQLTYTAIRGRVDKPVSIHLVFQRSRVYPLVVHYLWIAKRSCRAPLGTFMAISITKKGWRIEKDMAIQSLMSQKYYKKSLVHLNMHEQTSACLWTSNHMFIDRHYLPYQHDGWLAKWIEVCA